jgi:hypothetical protein
MADENKRDWHLEFGFHGFELEDEYYDLGSGLVLSRVKFPLEESDPISAFIIKMSLLCSKIPPTVILKTELKNKTENEIYSEFFILGRLFLLLGRGSVQTTSYYRYLLEGESNWRQPVTSSSFYTMSASYRIKNDIIPQLKSMITTLLSPLRDILCKTSVPKEAQPIIIALKRYHDAIVTHLDFDDTFLFGINCLESLFLKEDETQELMFRVQNRISLLFSYFEGFSSLEVRDNIRQAYKARNKTAHGGTITQNDRKQLQPVHVSLQNYARLSIQIFLQLRKIFPKKTLIDKLDEAFVDHSAREEIRNHIQKQKLQILDIHS